MFSNNDFLLAFSQYTNQPTPAPLTPAARGALAGAIMQSHPSEIARYLEFGWETHARLQAQLITGVGQPINPFSTPAPPQAPSVLAWAMSRALFDINYPAAAQRPSIPGFACHHLIYAYMVENTRLYELFARIIQLFNDGEKLGVTEPTSRQWLTTTEALFYRQQSAHDHAYVTTLTSDRRDDGRAIRRNAYWRMFAMDLNHGTDDNKPYPYRKPDASNKEFVSTFEALLRNLWVAIINVSNTNNVNPTDNAEIENLARRLHVMLRNRRINGTLAREEFSAVATLDWLRLAVSFDSPIVIDLRASAASEYERIKKMSERVGLPIHSKSDEYFELAGPLAGLLTGIENLTLTNTGQFLAFPDIDNIINNWSKVTGKVLKAMPRPVVKEVAA